MSRLSDLITKVQAELILYRQEQQAGTEDDVQTLLDAAKPGMVVDLPWSIYTLYKRIVIPPGVRLRGTGINSFYSGRDTKGTALGTRFEIRFGAGSSIDNGSNAAIVMRQGSALEGCYFYYPDQVKTGVPQSYAPTVWVESTDGGICSPNWIWNCHFANSYVAIDMRRWHAQMSIRDIRGAPLLYGIREDADTDFSFIEDVIWQPGDLSGDFSEGSLRAWCQDHVIGLEIGQTDWLQVHHYQNWAIATSVQFVNSESFGGIPGQVTFTDCGFDANSVADVLFSNTAHPAFNIKFSNCRFVCVRGFSGPQTGISTCIQKVPGAQILGLSFNNCEFRAGQSAIYFIGEEHGQLRDIQVTNCSLYDFRTPGLPCVVIQKCRGLVITGNIFDAIVSNLFVNTADSSLLLIENVEG